MLIGVFFDVFRILRKSFKTPDIITYIEDIFFWIGTGFFLIYIIFKFNSGELRGYIFVGLAIGILFYGLIFSKSFVNINTTIVKFIKSFIKRIVFLLLFPFKILKNLIFNSIKKLNNIIIFYVKKCKKDKKLQKKKEQKKDFENICRK